jgi:hypothetical protein
MKARILPIILLIFNPFGSCLWSQNTGAMHETWDMVAKKYVDQDGRVDYASIANEPMFYRYLGMLEKVKGADSYTGNDAKAYWINVYNAYTVRLVIENFPIESIKDIPNAFDTTFIHLRHGSFSLNQIENEIIRPTFNDPRIHFALNCAANSCPRLLNRAFLPETIDKDLDLLSKEFLKNMEMHRIAEKEAVISEIFKWYESDFVESGGVREFIKKHHGVRISDQTELQFMPYDWRLNSKQE